MTISALEPEAIQHRRRSLFPSLAAATLVSTVLLILVGGIVRVTGHGLGCPDWPLCYGQAIPPGYTGAWVEFSHRLVGAVTGVLIILVGILAWLACYPCNSGSASPMCFYVCPCGRARYT